MAMGFVHEKLPGPRDRRRSVDFRGTIFYHSPRDKEKKMAHHKSAVRQLRRSVRRTAVNKQNKSALRTEVRKVRDLAQAQKKEEALKALPGAQAVIDQSVKKGTIHRNKGNRLKSRLSRRARQAGAVPSP
jgi:small subunit ribosomal protein S20